jgi:RNA polymerase sigma factor (sigma-70 family)
LDGRKQKQGPMSSVEFEAAVLPHLDAAYNLARYLTRNPVDAEDVMQEAVLRAATYFSGFRGANPRAWLLQIVRNTASCARRSSCARSRSFPTRRSRKSRRHRSAR